MSQREIKAFWVWECNEGHIHSSEEEAAECDAGLLGRLTFKKGTRPIFRAITIDRKSFTVTIVEKQGGVKLPPKPWKLICK